MARKKLPETNSMDIFRFLRKSYDEAFSLLVFARDYFETVGKRDKAQMKHDDQLIYTLAVSTITTQLTSVMSWLMFCRAIENGEISPNKIDNKLFSVPEFNLGIESDDDCFSILGQTPREIFQKSCNIYNRMKRIEDSVREHLIETA